MKLYLIFTILFSVQALAGDGGGAHGGETAGEQSNPWFLGDKAIEYCVENPDPQAHPANLPKLKELVKESFEDWKKVFAKYGLDQVVLSFYKSDPTRPKGEVLNLRLSLNFVDVGECTNPDEQVRVIFSKKMEGDPILVAAPENSIGSAIRHRYNHSTYRNGGILWIHQRWDGKYPIGIKSLKPTKHVLLHEMGHMFGMRHGSTWVMHENLSQALVEDDANDAFGEWDNLGKIETGFWPYRLQKDTKYELHGYGPNYKLGEDPKLPSCILNYKANVNCFPSGIETTGIDDKGRLLIKITFQFTEWVPEKQGYLEKTYDGVFDVPQFDSFVESGGPVLSTFTSERTYANGYVARSPRVLKFDTSLFALPTTGYLMINGVKYPTVIDEKTGIRFKIFSPTQDRWLSYSRHMQGNLLTGKNDFDR